MLAIVMEPVERWTLRVCQIGTAVDDFLRLGVQMARAVAAAHARGIVHRHVKPENIIVREDGLVKLLDFGIARLAPDAPETPAGGSRAGTTAAGTPRYMSPEQRSRDEYRRPLQTFTRWVWCFTRRLPASARSRIRARRRNWTARAPRAAGAWGDSAGAYRRRCCGWSGR